MYKNIYCCECQKTVKAVLCSGDEIYQHRKDLCSLSFWKCKTCGNFVGCHKKVENGMKPLGCIPTPELKEARKNIHLLLDPLWKNGIIERSVLYETISKQIGWEYHTAKIKNMEEAKKVYSAIKQIILYL